MTLRDVIGELESLDEQATIYAEEPLASARAVVLREPPNGGLPPEAVGLRYLLEVSLAKGAVRVWSEWRGGATPTNDEKLAAVVYYAENDSFLPVE